MERSLIGFFTNLISFQQKKKKICLSVTNPLVYSLLHFSFCLPNSELVEFLCRYVDAQKDRVTVIFSTVFKDDSDVVIGKVFMQVHINCSF